MEKTYIRSATPQDFGRISELGAKSFGEDPLFRYLGCTANDEDASCSSATASKLYISFILSSCFQVGGIIDLLCTRCNETGEEKIIAASVWLPPRKRVTLLNLAVLWISGIFALALHIGLIGLWRLLWEFPRMINISWEEGRHSLDDPSRWSLSESWHLKLAFTDPQCRKKGKMSMLLRGRLEETPGASFTVEATTSESQTYFSRFNFEIMNRCRPGAGSVDMSGRPCNGGIGIEITNMVKHP